jgi:hypothetical protein
MKARYGHILVAFGLTAKLSPKILYSNNAKMPIEDERYVTLCDTI